MKQSPAQFGAISWLRKNIFNGVANSLLSLFLIALVATVLSSAIEWAVFNSVWNAESLGECQALIIAAHGAEAKGACWAALKGKISIFLFGFYPPGFYWRPTTALVLLFAALALFLFKPRPRTMRWFAVIYPVLAYYLIWGGFGLEVVNERMFGGLLLTLIVAVTGISIAIPTGIALALGRLYLILPLRTVCASVVVIASGVPLIVLLIVTVILLNLLLPPGTYIGVIFRAIAVVALHTGSRIAGAIRQELLAIPSGQWEAAKALGFSQSKTIWLIMLPQTLRNISPWIVLAAVGAFRDTALLSVIGLLEPVYLMNVFKADANWNGVVWEFALFVGSLYWIFCFCMTRYSKFLERKINAEGHHPINLNNIDKARTVICDSIS